MWGCVIRYCYKVSSDERSECLGICTLFLPDFFLFFPPGRLTKHFFAYVRGRPVSFQYPEGCLDLLAGVLTHFRPFSGPNSHFHTFSTPGVSYNRLAWKMREIDDYSDEKPWKPSSSPRGASRTLENPGKRVKTPSSTLEIHQSLARSAR